MPATDTFEVAELEWELFLDRFDWRQDEHVSLIGPTHTGKTTLAVQLLHRRTYVVAVGTKPEDDTFVTLKHDGYRLVDEIPSQGRPPRVIIWPRSRTLNKAAKARQARVIRKAFDDAYGAGSWCVFVDEASYVARTLKLADELTDLWQQGRAVHLSVIACTQRPRHVPLDMYSAASHLFFWRTNDTDDIKRIAGLNGADTRAVRSIVAQLPRFDVLYVNTRTGELAITRPPPLDQ